jgi:hypothetical protein
MAPLTDQGTGDREGKPWMQPANGLQDLEGGIAFFTDPYMMQPENSLQDPGNDIAFFTDPYMTQLENDFWNPQDDANLNEIFPDMRMMQAAVGRNGTPQSFSTNINNLVANGSDPRGYTDANIPRGDVAMEEIITLATTPIQVEESNIEPQHLQGNTILAENGQDEPEYVTHAQITKRARTNSGPSSDEWQRWKPEIKALYVDDNYTLEVTRAEMAKKGFYAESVTLPSFSLIIAS